MKLSTIIMVTITGTILGLLLKGVITTSAILLLSFIMGGLITYVNETNDTLF